MTTTNEQVLSVSLAARGLWTACRNWTRRRGTMGFIPYAVVDNIAPKGTVVLVCELTRAGLWQVADGGWRMVRMYAQGGSVRRVISRVIKGTRARAMVRTRGKESGVG